MDLATQKMFEKMASDAEKLARYKKRQQHIEEFKTLNARELLKWDDSKLAAWQTQYESDEAQWVLADQEWKRRTGICTRRIAITAIAVSILSLAIAAIGYFFPKTTPISSQEKTIDQAAKQSQLPTQSLPTNQILNSQKSQTVN